jgi:hypothetical protein
VILNLGRSGFLKLKGGDSVSLFNVRLRIATRLELRGMGKGFWEIQEAMSNFTDDLPEVAAREAGVSIPPQLMAVPGEGFGAIGDGTILKAIMDFLKSEQGQALIKILVSLLIAAI